jgi:CheY-like chemotaxis protein
MNNKKTILIVEDDEDDREILSEVVRGVNDSASIAFAENGLLALDYLTQTKESEELPCLIVLDLNMPYLDGRQTCRRIKNELKLDDIPIIVFTSSHNPNDKVLFESQGVEFITKPEDFSSLQAIVKHMLDVCCFKVNANLQSMLSTMA